MHCNQLPFMVTVAASGGFVEMRKPGLGGGSRRGCYECSLRGWYTTGTQDLLI